MRRTYEPKTVEEAESETVWPLQSFSKERKQGIQARNIAAVASSSCVSRFAARILPSLEPTKSRKAPQDPVHVEGDLEWEVERIIKSKIISYR